MREESHLDEMRNAIRGDFERLAERRGEQELMRVSEPGTAEEEPPEQPLEEQPVGALEPSTIEEAPEEQPEAPEQEAESEPPQRSWLARMFSP